MSSNKKINASIHSAGGRTPLETRSMFDGLELNPAIPLINKLPPEVLANIMRIVVSSAPCCWVDQWYSRRPIEYPEALSHVCSHWRLVAIQSRQLWSHIDITTWKAPSSRAITLLDRAGQSPLNLHVVGFGHTTSINLVPFLVPITTRLKSLDLVIQSDSLSEAYTSILHTCLLGGTAGNLTELVIRFANRHSLRTFFFIRAGNHPHNAIVSTHSHHQGGWVHIDTPQEFLEDLLKGITVLRLDLIYPEWTSSAYHGLVELRLLGGRMCRTSITESQLINILRHSSRLRILHFDLVIVDLAPLDTTVGDPIVLRDLEVLSIDWMQKDGIETFFRWLAPSPKLFQFHFNPYGGNFKHPATITFLASSSITMIHAESFSLEEVVDLVGLCQHARFLALNNINLDDMEENFPIKLHTLYLLPSTLNVNRLRRWILPGSIQRLVLYDPEFYRGGFKLTPDQIISVLSGICSEVVVLQSDDPNPVEEWEVFWDIDN